MGLLRKPAAPTVDGNALDLGTLKLGRIEIPAGIYTPPVDLQFTPGGTLHRVESFPWRGVVQRSQLAVLTPPGSVGTIIDLQVISVTESSVTVRYTTQNDGTGSPAKVEIRIAPTSTFSWGSAVPIGGVISGGTIGVQRDIELTGLDSETAYTVQAVCYRGTLNVDAVFGSLSNTDEGTTDASASAPAAPTLSLISESGGIALSRSSSPGATAHKLYRKVNDTTAPTPGVDTPFVADMPSTYNDTATTEGNTYSYWATAANGSGESAVSNRIDGSPESAGETLFPNESIIGASVIMIDEPFQESPTALLNNAEGGAWDYQAMSRASHVVDASAPISADYLRVTYPAGFASSSSPIGCKNGEIGAWTPRSKQYIAFTVRFSPGFQKGPDDTTKIMYFGMTSKPDSALGEWYVNMNGGGYVDISLQWAQGGAEVCPIQFDSHRRLGAPGQASCNLARSGTQRVASTRVDDGNWHTVEIYAENNTTVDPNDGRIRLWVDGILQFDFQDCRFWNSTTGTGKIKGVALDPVFGGGEGFPVVSEQYQDWSHLRIRTRD